MHTHTQPLDLLDPTLCSQLAVLLNQQHAKAIATLSEELLIPIGNALCAVKYAGLKRWINNMDHQQDLKKLLAQVYSVAATINKATPSHQIQHQAALDIFLSALKIDPRCIQQGIEARRICYKVLALQSQSAMPTLINHIVLAHLLDDLLLSIQEKLELHNINIDILMQEHDKQLLSGISKLIVMPSDLYHNISFFREAAFEVLTLWSSLIHTSLGSINTLRFNADGELLAPKRIHSAAIMLEEDFIALDV